MGIWAPLYRVPVDWANPTPIARLGQFRYIYLTFGRRKMPKTNSAGTIQISRPGLVTANARAARAGTSHLGLRLLRAGHASQTEPKTKPDRSRIPPEISFPCQ